MATDITTLAIAIQSQEAERNLQTFNSLMLESSKLAAPLEKITLAVDASAALAQIQALKTGYDDLADSIGGLGGIPDLSSANAGNMEAMNEFFAVTAEMSKMFRDELAQLNDAMQMLEANAGKVGSAGTSSTASMSAAVTVSAEYAAKVREVAAAQKELEKAVAQADAAMKATVEADEDAAAVKKRLDQAQRELAQVSKQLAATHRGMSGDIIELSEREEYLKNKVAELKNVYEEAKAAAEKFNQKLEESGEKADAARQRHQELKAQLDAMPQPMANVNGGMSDFSKTARGAATQATKMARGFNAVAFAAGASIPGLSKIGQVIGTFAYAGPVIGSIVVGVGALAAGIKYLYEESQKGYKLAHEYAIQAQKDVQNVKENIASLDKEWDRLGELEAAGTLTNEQNTEASRIIEHLTEVYGDLGLGIDAVTRKLNGYSQARAEANEREREHEIRMAKYALNNAQSSYDASQKELSEIGSWYQHRDEQRDTIKYRLSQLKNTSQQEVEEYFEEWKQELQAVTRGKKEYRWRTKNGRWAKGEGGDADYHFGVSRGEAEEELKMLTGEKGLIAAYKRAAEAKKKLDDLRIQPQAVFNTQRELLTKQGLSVDENGNARLLTEAEKYSRQKAEIHKLEQDIATEIQRRGKFSAEHLRLEAQRQKLLLSTLQYEQRITAEQEKRRTAMYTRHKWDAGTGTFARKNSADIDKDRSREQDRLYREMNEMRAAYSKRTGRNMDLDFYNGKLPKELQLEFGKKRNRYDELSIQRSEAEEARQAAKKQLETSRRDYVFDRQGNMVRRKTEAERLSMMKQEIAAQKAKVKATTEGSTERYQEQQKLDAMQQKYIQERMKNSAPAFAQQQIRNNSTVVQGIQARSSEALRLQARNFNRPENGFKDIGTSVKSIYDELKTIAPDTKTIADKTSALVEMIETV